MLQACRLGVRARLQVISAVLFGQALSGTAYEVPDKIYWTSSASNAISRANLADGSEVEEVLTGASSPWGIVIDAPRCSMYWTDYASYTIQRAHLDGSGAEAFLTLDSRPMALWKSEEDERLYWTQEDGRLKRASYAPDSDGTVEELVTFENSYLRRHGIAVDNSESPPMIYFSDTDEYAIMKQTWGTVEEDDYFADGGSIDVWWPGALGIDTVDNMLYFADEGYEDIRRVSMASDEADSVEVVITGEAGEVPRGFYLDSAKRKLYFSVIPSSSAHKISQADLSGNIDWTITLNDASKPAGIAIMDSSLTEAAVCFTTTTSTSATITTTTTTTATTTATATTITATTTTATSTTLENVPVVPETPTNDDSDDGSDTGGVNDNDDGGENDNDDGGENDNDDGGVNDDGGSDGDDSGVNDNGDGEANDSGSNDDNDSENLETGAGDQDDSGDDSGDSSGGPRSSGDQDGSGDSPVDEPVLTVTGTMRVQLAMVGDLDGIGALVADFPTNSEVNLALREGIAGSMSGVSADMVEITGITDAVEDSRRLSAMHMSSAWQVAYRILVPDSAVDVGPIPSTGLLGTSVTSALQPVLATVYADTEVTTETVPSIVEFKVGAGGLPEQLDTADAEQETGAASAGAIAVVAAMIIIPGLSYKGYKIFIRRKKERELRMQEIEPSEADTVPNERDDSPGGLGHVVPGLGAGAKSNKGENNISGGSNSTVGSTEFGAEYGLDRVETSAEVLSLDAEIELWMNSNGITTPGDSRQGSFSGQGSFGSQPLSSQQGSRQGSAAESLGNSRQGSAEDSALGYRQNSLVCPSRVASQDPRSSASVSVLSQDPDGSAIPVDEESGLGRQGSGNSRVAGTPKSSMSSLPYLPCTKAVPSDATWRSLFRERQEDSVPSPRSAYGGITPRSFRHDGTPRTQRTTSVPSLTGSYGGLALSL